MTETSRATCRTSGLSLVLCPRLPPIEAALTHLHRIDATRIYCNKGALWHEFCDGMAASLGAGAVAANVRGAHQQLRDRNRDGAARALSSSRKNERCQRGHWAGSIKALRHHGIPLQYLLLRDHCSARHSRGWRDYSILRPVRYGHGRASASEH